MSKSKTIEILQQLSARQHNRLRDYLYSDYFNKNESVRRLYDHLRQAPESEKESAFAVVFGEDAPYKAAEMNHLLSHLGDLVIAFLGQEQWQQNPVHHLHAAMQVLRQYGLVKHFTTAARQHERLWQRQPRADVQRLWELYLHHSEMDAFFLMKPRRVYDSHLQEKSNTLDAFYIAEKLRIACDMTNRNIVINANYECRWLPEIESTLRQNPQYLEVPVVRIYYTILNMLRNNEDADYQQLRQLIQDHIYDFSVPDIQGICDYAQNYCIRKINSGQGDYYAEFLNMYKFQLQYHILYRNGYLEEWDYKNIVTAGIRLKDFEWTEQFIHNSRSALRTQVSENAYCYNLAAFYHATRQYREALRWLQDVDFTDMSYHLGAKIIQLKIYYELQETSALEALADAFRLLVQRSRDLSEYRRRANLNFIRLTQKMARLREQKDYTARKKWEKAWEELRQNAVQMQPLANAEWIQEQLGAAIYFSL